MEVEAQYGDQVRFIGIPGLSDVPDMEQFVASTRTDAFPHIPDPDSIIWDRFGVTKQRTYVYVNDDGTWQTSGYGSLEADVVDLIGR